MSYKNQFDKLKGTWSQFIATGVWIASVAGSFLLPLPSWNLGDEKVSFTKFILFFATVIAGYIVILTFKLKKIKTWMLFSMVSFSLFVGIFFIYSVKRESSTVIYYGTTKIIGNVQRTDYVLKYNAVKEELGREINDPSELLYFAGGNANLLWTDESITVNRWKLIILLMFCYTFLSVFMVSFSNYIRLVSVNI